MTELAAPTRADRPLPAAVAARVRAGAPGRLRLKPTPVNPQTTPDDIDRLLGLIAAAGAAEDQPALQ